MLFPGPWHRRLLLVLFLGALQLSCAAQTGTLSAAEARAVVQRAIHRRIAENSRHQPLRFLWRKKDDRRDATRDVIETPQGDVALLVALNGQALSEEAQQAEFARLDNLAAHPELQEHRRRREAEDRARVDKLLHLLPDALLYHYEATEPCDVGRIPEIAVPGLPPTEIPPAVQPGQSCYRMSFRPNPKFDPPDMSANILQGMVGEIWIAKSEERLVRLQAHLITDVQFGWGFIGRLNKGGTVYVEQADIGGGDWELTRMELNLTGRLLLFKPLTIRIREEEGSFARVEAGIDYRQAIKILKASAPWNHPNPGSSPGS